MTRQTRIVVNCSHCGVLRVSPPEVTVRGGIDDGAWSYRFICPHCLGHNVGDGAMAALMDAVNAGAAFEARTMPTNLHDHPDGPLFSSADVLEFRRLMLEPNWFYGVTRGDVE
jgi:hypothetical protein